MDEETKKHLAELEARVAELDRQNKARDAELAAANEALRSTKTALQQLRDEKAAAASKAREDQIAALRTKARATGKFAPGTETEKLFDQLCALEDLAAAERFVAVLEPTLPIGVPPQYTPSAPGPAPTADKFAAALQRHGWSPDEIRIQRAMLRQQGTSEEIFLAQLTAHDAALADDAPPDAVGSPSLNPLPTLGFGGTAAFLTPGKE